MFGIAVNTHLAGHVVAEARGSLWTEGNLVTIERQTFCLGHYRKAKSNQQVMAWTVLQLC